MCIRRSDFSRELLQFATKVAPTVNLQARRFLCLCERNYLTDWILTITADYSLGASCTQRSPVSVVSFFQKGARAFSSSIR